uniref:Uncharacterized protein n=1 Tax=Physcomitrium patens TaxID=3218 RepID=A0A2K1KTA2_PHYPA|nr:hypothetical protein PHYPA_004006 [Physcomitrium patens]
MRLQKYEGCLSPYLIHAELCCGLEKMLGLALKRSKGKSIFFLFRFGVLVIAVVAAARLCSVATIFSNLWLSIWWQLTSTS